MPHFEKKIALGHEDHDEDGDEHYGDRVEDRLSLRRRRVRGYDRSEAPAGDFGQVADAALDAVYPYCADAEAVGDVAHHEHDEHRQHRVAGVVAERHEPAGVAFGGLHEQKSDDEQGESELIDRVEVEPARLRKRAQEHEGGHEHSARDVAGHERLSGQRPEAAGERAHRHKQNGLPGEDAGGVLARGARQLVVRQVAHAQPDVRRAHEGQHEREEHEVGVAHSHEQPLHAFAGEDGERVVDGDAHGVERPVEFGPHEDERGEPGARSHEAGCLEEGSGQEAVGHKKGRPSDHGR
ncbi:MAG: hypothetical protein LKH29_07690 [Eggerthellaceae bacterium]|jgi:hypothetical protein|nr:hypothetical protein [Eggerthellaceae bacterium]